ncbi:MAG: hypothetical protein QXJ59_05560 [Thermofilaceae archaeon]
MRVVYAYYNPPRVQTMREHLELALRVFPPGSRLVREGEALAPGFRHLLNLCILMHDFGKTLFQPVPNQKLSFTGHEAFSGWAVYQLLEGKETAVEARGKLGVQTPDTLACVLAVLLHHHPMNPAIRLGVKKRHITREHVEAFLGSVGDLVDKHLPVSSSEFKELLLSALNLASGPETAVEGVAVEQVYRVCWGRAWMGGEPRSRKLLLLLLQGLVAADYESSRSREPGKPSTFSQAVSKFLASYAQPAEPGWSEG